MPKRKSKLYNLSLSLLLKNLGIYYYYLGKFLILLTVLIILGAFLISLFDHKNFAESLYVAFITATTVGYGDITPTTYASKIVAVFLGIIGIIFTGSIITITFEAIRLTLKEQLSPEEIEKLKT